MLIVVTPATASRLTTVQAVRERFGLSGGEVDADLALMIDAASEMAATFCNRTFGLETVKQVEVIDRYAKGILLERSPAKILSINEGGAALAPEFYHLDQGTGLLGRLANGGASLWGGRIEITYETGWKLPGEDGANLPAVIEHAVLLLIGAMRSMGGRDPLVKSETVDGIGRTDFWVPGPGNILPDPTAEKLLQPYRRYG